MELDALLHALEATAVATAIRENDVLFPWVEALHVLAITLVIGTVAIVDLRLLGFASHERAVTGLTRDVLPCTWAAFVVAVISGALLFASNADAYVHNAFFQRKFVFMAMAGINMIVFHLYAGRDVERWGAPSDIVPLRARIVGGISLILWIAVVACGRWVGFTLHATPVAG